MKLIQSRDNPFFKSLKRLAESGREASASLLRAGVDFTAVFAGNDNMACGAIEALRASGLSVPGDISVVRPR